MSFIFNNNTTSANTEPCDTLLTFLFLIVVAVGLYSVWSYPHSPCHSEFVGVTCMLSGAVCR